MPDTMQSKINPSSNLPLWLGVAMMSFALAAATVASISGIGSVPAQPLVVSATKELVFLTREEGIVVAIEPGVTGKSFVFNSARGEGFVQVAIDSFKRAREADNVADDTPFRLLQQPDGRVWLEDTSSHQRILLDAFGRSNQMVFEKIFTNGKVTP